jgi:sugar/nucleoside kinase (ribokinase family)
VDQKKKIIEILFIGHLAIDSIIRFKAAKSPTLGGSVSYGSIALSCYTDRVKIGIVSNLGSKNFNNELLNKLKMKKIDLEGIKWFDSLNTNFVLDYQDHSRTLILKSKSPNLEFKDFPESYIHFPPKVIVLVPLCNEISYDYVKKIIETFPRAYFGIDIQGFIRNIDMNGNVSYIIDQDLIKNLKSIIHLVGDKLILKGSEIEMKLVSRETNLIKVMEYFKKFDNEGIYIMTLGESGSLIMKKGRDILKIPAFKSKVVTDETGAGDVYLAIFLYELFNSNRSWRSIEKAGLLASSAASFLIEKDGPSGCESKEEVMKRVKEKKHIKD